MDAPTKTSDECTYEQFGKACCGCTNRAHMDSEVAGKKKKVLANDDMNHTYILYGIYMSNDKMPRRQKYLPTIT